MKEKHKIEVRSGRVVFTIELERNITILRGDSATGKTTLVEMLQAYETYGRQSGVTVSCDKPCRVLSGVNWELQLNATHDSIVFVDEGSTFVSSLDFARAIQHSDNYYVLVTREDLSTLPYSVNAILELKKTTSRFKRTYNKAYPVYDSLTASNVQLESVEKLLTEDANSGYQLFTKVGEKYGIVCISAAGKDNIESQPESNPTIVGHSKKYQGIGRVLIAYGIKLSIDHECGGTVTFEAKVPELAEHYVRDYGACPLPSFGGAPRYELSGEAAMNIFVTYLK